MRSWTHILVLALFIGASSVSGAASCPALSHVEVAPKTEYRDTAVELELPLSLVRKDTGEWVPNRRLLAILTTQDGTLGPVLDNRWPPWWLWRLARQRGYRRTYDMKWDDLDPDQKYELLKKIARKRHVSRTFFENRLIPGLKVRDEVQFEPKEEVEVFGRQLVPGQSYKLKIGQFFGKVEHEDPETAEKLGMVELHFRAGQKHQLSAGAVSNNASALLRALGFDPPHQHVHIVAPLPVKELEADPLEAMVMTDFYRRANLALEMVSLVEYWGDIRNKKKALNQGWGKEKLNVSLFGSMDAGFLGEVGRSLEQVAGGGSLEIGNRFKMAYAALRGSDKYDSEEPLWGLEVRSVPRGADPALTRRLIDAFQYAMLNRTYGVPRERLARWSEARGAKAPDASSLSVAWHNREWKELFGEAPKPVKKELGRFLWGADFRVGLVKTGQEHLQLKMVVHDWSRDPLFYDNPKALEKIEREQVRALKRLKDEEESTAVIRDFLLDSGIYETVLKSLNVRGV